MKITNSKGTMNNIKSQFYKVKSWRLSTKIIAGVIIITSLILIISLTSKKEKTELPVYKTQSGPFREFLSINGILESESSVKISAPTVHGWRFTLIKLIPEGSLVKKGDFIADFDVSDIKERIEAQEMDIENQYSELEDLKQSHEMKLYTLDDQLKNAEDTLKINELTLTAMEYSSELSRKKAEIQVEKAKTGIEQAKRNINTQKLKNQIEIKKKQKRIKQVERQLEKSKKDLVHYKVYAPANGIVIYPLLGRHSDRNKVQEGDVLHNGQTFGNLPDLSRMMVQLEINEVEINRIQKNLKVTIILDSYKEKTYTGYIKNISRIAIQDSKNELIKNFDCYVKINETDIDHLKPGISAVCKITISTQDNAIAVPIESIFRNKNNEPVCFIKKSATIITKKVELGPRNENFIVVKSGLQQNDRVLLVYPFEDEISYEDYKIDEYIKLQQKAKKPGDKEKEPDTEIRPTKKEPDTKIMPVKKEPDAQSAEKAPKKKPTGKTRPKREKGKS